MPNYPDKVELAEILKASNLFIGVNSKEIVEILSNTHFQLREYNKNDIIALNGETVNSLMIVVKGAVRGEMIDFSGKTLKIEDIQAPSSLASAFIFGSQNMFPVNVTATNECTILKIEVNELIKLFKTNDTILRNFLNTISNRAQFLTNKMKFLSFKTLKQKLAQFILQLSEKKQSDVVRLPKTITELADFFGSTRPSLSRIIAELEKEQILKLNKKEITILNKTLLKQYTG